MEPCFGMKRKKETISPNYVAHQLKASSFAYKSKASRLHLLHMLLRDSSTILSVQNEVRGWHSNVCDIYIMKKSIWQSKQRWQLIQEQTDKFYVTTCEGKVK
jgi:hypothetical protein